MKLIYAGLSLSIRKPMLCAGGAFTPQTFPHNLLIRFPSKSAPCLFRRQVTLLSSRVQFLKYFLRFVFDFPFRRSTGSLINPLLLEIFHKHQNKFITNINNFLKHSYAELPIIISDLACLFLSIACSTLYLPDYF